MAEWLPGSVSASAATSNSGNYLNGRSDGIPEAQEAEPLLAAPRSVQRKKQIRLSFSEISKNIRLAVVYLISRNLE